MKRVNVNLLYDAMNNFLEFHRSLLERIGDSKNYKEITSYKFNLEKLKKK